MKNRITAEPRFLQELFGFVAKYIKLVPLKTQVSPVSSQFL